MARSRCNLATYQTMNSLEDITFLSREDLLAPAVLTSVVAGAAVCAHITLEIRETPGHFPLWAPLSYEMVRLTGPWALRIFIVAAVVVAGATGLETIARYTRNSTQTTRLNRGYQ